jgi:iron-regulated transporter 1
MKDEEDQDVLTCTSSTNNSSDDDLQYARRLLYLSHFGSQFAEWAWQFSLVIWLAALSNYSSLFLVSVYQATAQLMVLVLVPQLTKSIDTTALLAAAGDDDETSALNRSQFASYVITAQNTCVLIATITIGFVMSRQTNNNNDESDSNHVDGDDDSSYLVLSLIVICIFGGMAQVLDKTFVVAVERDWIVVMANKKEAWLQDTNVTLKQIDLTCQVLGPSISGWVLATGGGVSWVGGCTVLSLITEYICMNQVYHLVPSLQHRHHHHKQQQRPQIQQQLRQQNNVSEKSSLEPDQLQKDIDNKTSSRTTCCNYYCQNHMQVYASQTMAWAGLGLALLYFNVLTFSGMMTAYLVSCGMSLTAVGIWRGIASLVGLLGTFAFSQAQHKFHLELETTAMWSIVWEFVWLSISLGSIFVDSEANASLAATLLIAGVLPSRIGLWVYDISVTQLFQQTVAPNARGQVGGTQMSLNAFFEFLPYVFGMVYSDVSEFWILMVGGYISVGLAMMLCIFGVYLPYSKNYTFEPVLKEDQDEKFGDVQLVDR